MKSRWVLITAAVLCLVALPSVAVAQSADGKDAGVLALKQARQATLARLNASRETFIGEIVERWSSVAKSRGLDDASWRADMTNALSAMQPDRLVAAYESASYNDLLTAMNAKPQKFSDAHTLSIRPLMVGDEATDLVFTPVEPCRILNTFLGTGVYAGPLVPGVPRDYAHNQNLAAQGGNAAGCGIPTDPAAIAVTLTVAAPAGPGNLRAWPLGSPVPNASVINYANVAGLALANTHILPTCQVCGNDFTVRADVSGTHFIADVVGYFWRPTACAGGQAALLGECFETGIRGATTVFGASDACRALGGRLGNQMELRSVRDVLALDAVGEWTDGIESDDNASYRSMIIADGGAFTAVATISGHPYRCVFSQFAH
jgi:hypothetical protein